MSSGWDQTMTGGVANGSSGGGGTATPGMPRQEEFQAPAWLRHLAWPALVVLGTVGLLLALLSAWEDSSGASQALHQAAEYTGAGVLAGAAAHSARSAAGGGAADPPIEGERLLQSTLEELRMQSAMQTQVSSLLVLAVSCPRLLPWRLRMSVSLAHRRRWWALGWLAASAGWRRRRC